MRKPIRTYAGSVLITVKMLLAHEEQLEEALDEPVTHAALEQRIKERMQAQYPTIVPKSLHVNIQPVLALDPESMQVYLIDLHKGEDRRKELVAALNANGVIVRRNTFIAEYLGAAKPKSVGALDTNDLEAGEYQLVYQDQVYTLPSMQCKRCGKMLPLWQFATWIDFHPWCVQCRKADPLEAKRVADRLRYYQHVDDKEKMSQMGGNHDSLQGKNLQGKARLLVEAVQADQPLDDQLEPAFAKLLAEGYTATQRHRIKLLVKELLETEYLARDISSQQANNAQ